MRNLLTAAGVALVLVAGLPGQAGDAQLRQELGNLKFRLDYETDRLERRLEAAERQLRQLESQRGPVRVDAVPALPAAPLPPVTDELTLRRLTITDEEGRIRATLAVSSLYGPMLGLLDEHGEVAVLLGAGGEGAALEIFDERTVARLWLGLRDGLSQLQLAGPDGEIHSRLPGGGDVRSR